MEQSCKSFLFYFFLSHFDFHQLGIQFEIMHDSDIVSSLINNFKVSPNNILLLLKIKQITLLPLYKV